MIGRRPKRQERERARRDEWLSAYLDGQLSASERARLESQLAADPALQAELEALRQTVALVRDLPPVPVPRNFILPQTAATPRPVSPARPRRTWVAPLLTATTAVVSLLFVLVLAGDLWLSGMGGRAFAPAVEPPVEVEAPVEEVALASPTVSEKLEVEATVEVEKIVVEGEAIEEEAPLAPTASPSTVAPAPLAPTAPAVMEVPPPSEQAAAGGGPAEEPAVAPTVTPAPTAVLEEAPDGTKPTPSSEISEATEALPPPAEDEELELMEPQIRALRVGPEGEETETGQIPPWRLLEATLGLIALGLMVATVWAWRARRR